MCIKIAYIPFLFNIQILYLVIQSILSLNPHPMVNTTLLGDMPVKFIDNYFVTFVYRYQVLGFIGNYAVCELPVKSKGKCFITAI